MLRIVRLGSHRRKAWSTELCTQTGLACMIGMLCCHVLLLQHAMLAPAQLLFDCLHIGMWRLLKKSRVRDRGVCVPAKREAACMSIQSWKSINISMALRNSRFSFQDEILNSHFWELQFQKMISRKKYVFENWFLQVGFPKLLFRFLKEGVHELIN